MTSEQNIEGALLLNEEPLERSHDCFAFIDQQAEVAVDQIFEALLDLKLEPVASRDFVRTPSILISSASPLSSAKTGRE